MILEDIWHVFLGNWISLKKQMCGTWTEVFWRFWHRTESSYVLSSTLFTMYCYIIVKFAAVAPNVSSDHRCDCQVFHVFHIFYCCETGNVGYTLSGCSNSEILYIYFNHSCYAYA